MRLLFLCVGNSCRSQMAEAFARHYGGNSVQVASAGTRPRGYVHPLAVAVMQEIGVPMVGQTSKPLAPEMFEDVDRIVTMGCGDDAACPARRRPAMEDWALSDPEGQSIEVFRHVRDEIARRVRLLLAETPSAGPRRN